MTTTLITRLCFAVAVVFSIVFMVLGSSSIQIETDLNDLNPSKIDDPGLKKSIDILTKDVSRRFVVVVKGREGRTVAQATDELEASLTALPELSVVNNAEVQANYLSVLTPYRFHLLSEKQRATLAQESSEQIARDAQRQLYQLGTGVRLIPFEMDPLGWFSDYLLARMGSLSVDSSQINEGKATTEIIKSFSVQFDDYPQSMEQQAQLYQAIRDIEAHIAESGNVTVLHSGMFFFAVDSASSAKQDIQLIAVGSVVAILVLMLLVFRSLLPLMLSLGSIALGVGFGLVTSTFVFGSVHILTIVFGASLIGIVVDYSLHYFYHFLSHNPDKNQTLGQPDSLFRAMLLSVITSLVGYGALGLSDLLILKKVALFSCSGLLMAWLSVIVLGPLVTRRAIEARQSLLRQVIYGIQAVFARRPRLLVANSLILAFISVAYLYLGEINVNDDPRRFFHVSPTLISQEQEVASLTQVFEPGRYIVVKGNDTEAVFNSLNTLYEKLGDDHQSLLSVLDWLPSPSRQAENYQRQLALYADGGALDKFAIDMDLPAETSAAVKTAYGKAKGLTLNFAHLMQQMPSLPALWMEQDGAIYSFALIRKNSDLAKIEHISQQIADIHFVNTLKDATKALKVQRETGTELLVLAYLLVGLLLAAYYRRVSSVLLLLIPMTASVITLALVSLTGQAITIFHIMALFLVLGLGMDYIIFAKEMVSQRATTGQAILLSAVTSLLSFGLLAFSSMPIVQAFGSTILIGNTINFIAAISLFNEQ